MTNKIAIVEFRPQEKLYVLKVFAVFALALASNGCVGVPDNTAEPTPIRDLTGKPTEFFDQVITVQGYLTAEFENYNIWENAQAEEEFNCRRGVGIDPLINVSRFNRKTVRITGTFRTWCPEDYAPDVGPDDDICFSTGSCGDTEIRFRRIQEIK